MFDPTSGPVAANDDDPPAASRAEQAARQASDAEISPGEKRAIAQESSREEDA